MGFSDNHADAKVRGSRVLEILQSATLDVHPFHSITKYAFHEEYVYKKKDTKLRQ